MDWYFNRKIPQLTPKQIILPPMSKTFINGIAKYYDDRYSPYLAPYIDLLEYNMVINKINDSLISTWPCGFCLLFGYGLSPCTLGLSLLCPFCFIWEATSELVKNINEANQMKLNAKGLHMSLQRRCCTSWLQIDINETPDQIFSGNNDDDEKTIDEEGA